MKTLKLMLLLTTLLWSGTIQAQSLTYGFAFDISNGGIANATFSVINEETNPNGIAFNNDGTKMFVVGGTTDAVQQYALSSPFNTTTGVSLAGSFSVSSQEGFPTDITFNSDGTKMYITGNFSDGVNQYILDTPFDITDNTKVTFDDLFELPGNASVASLSFNADGTKLFLVNGFEDIDQYTLTTPFDVTGTVTNDMISFDTNPEGNTVRGFDFSPNGFKLFIAFDDGNSLGTVVNQYSLTNAFDISAGATFDQDLDILDIENTPKDFAFSADGTRLFILGGQPGLSITASVTQFSFDIGGYSETAANDGTVEGSLKVNLFEETFNDAGGTLTLTTDYSVTGIPAGLSPVLSVDASGSFATLTLTGTASDHQNINDVSDLRITFQNSAFSGGDASVFDNVTNASTTVGIDFLDNVQSITYGSAFNLSGGVTLTGNSDNLTTIARDASGLAFSDDGMTLFVLSGFNNQVIQYSLGSLYDVTSGLTLEGSPFSLTNEESGISTGITFSADGMKMFIVGNTRMVRQYDLTVPFNITSGVTFSGNEFSVTAQEASPQDVAFSADGTRMLIVGSQGDEVNSYDLITPFDISAGVTFDGVPFSILTEETEVRDFSFSSDGTRMFIVGEQDNDITQYNLSIPFDLTSEVIAQSSLFSVDSEEMSPFGITFSRGGDRLFIVGRDETTVFQYDLAIGGFTESARNDGSVDGSVTISILGDKFNSAGSTLTRVTDYEISNLPVGLTPTLTVAADGFSASLTLSGEATDNQHIHDVSSLEFTFENAAFEGGDALEVTNAIDASSSFSIDFRDNNPILSYGLSFDLLNTSFVDDFRSLIGGPDGLVFSDDGSKMLIAAQSGNFVRQFNLATPFDITSGVTIEETSLDISDEVSGTSGMAFNSDGTKMFILGMISDRVSQYSLSTPYEIISGVTFEGSTGNLENEDQFPQSLAFSADGMKMFIAGSENDVINQYSLTTAFDVTDGVSFDNVAFSVANEEGFPTGLAFSANGLRMFVVGTDNANVNQYRLMTPFDLSTGVNLLDVDFNVGGEESTPQEIAFSGDGSRLFTIGRQINAVNQYDLGVGSFEENAANDGTVDGEVTISILDDSFINAGGALTFNTDYAINNLPAGLTPSLTVAADGYSAMLTFNDAADSHLNANDISSLEFTFENSAFNNSSAVDVANAIDTESNIGIDFRASEETDILTFVFAEQSQVAVINTTNHAVEIEVLSGTDQSSLTPTIAISDGASIAPVVGERDFSGDVTYTVTSESGADQVWTVSVDQLGLSGTYTVGSGGDYETLAQFIATVDIAGMDGAVTLQILDNHSETGEFVFDNLEETLFIRPETNVSMATFSGSFLIDNSRVRFLGEGGVNSQQITINGTNENAPAIRLEGTKDGSTFSHLKVNYVGQSGINLDGDGVSVDVYYCEFNHTSPSLIGVALGVHGTPSMGEVLVSNSKFLSFNGENSSAVQVYNTAYIYNNVIFINTPGATSAIGIRVVDGAGEVVIDQNTIHITGGASDQISGSVGVFAKSTASGRFEIANNVISIDRLTNILGSSVGVQYQTGSPAALVDHNQIDDYSSLVDNWLFGVGNSIELDISDFPNSTSSLTEFTDAGNGDLTLTGISLLNDDFRSTFSPSQPNFAEGGTQIRKDHNEVDRNVSYPSKGAFEYDNELANLLTFSVPDQTTTPTIDAANRTIDLTITSGASISQTPTIEISNGATINPASGASQDFSEPVTYTVTSEVNSISQDWEVTINASPISVDLDENEHDELLAANTPFSSFFVNDPNTNDTHTVELVSGAGDTDNALFEVDGTSLINLESFDFETQEEYAIRLRATDPAGLFVESAVSVFVNDVNEAPLMVDQSFEIVEHAAGGTVIGTIVASDPENGTLTFDPITGEGAASFSLTAGGVLSAAAPFDFEEQGETRSVDIRVRDEADLTATATITITITDINETPTVLVLSSTNVDESNPTGSIVGELSTTDQDVDDTHSYSLVSGSGDTGNAAFDISGSNLITSTILDFETQDSYSVRIQTEDNGGLTFQEVFTISVNDLPAQVTSLTIDNTTLDENEAIGTMIGQFTTTGEDLSDDFTYTLVAGSGDADNGAFDISGDQLQVATVINFEAQNSYNVRVQTDDGGGNVLESSFTITIEDVQEDPTGLVINNNSIVENNDIGAVIGNFSSTDEDADESFTYALVSGAGDDDNAAFEIVGDELQATQVFDFESESSYSIRVATEDTNGGTYQESFTITIEDENESIVIVNPIDDAEQNEGFATVEIDISNVFEDEDGDNLTYVATSADEDIATVSVSGTTLTITEEGSFGTTVITLTADDGSGVTISDAFEFTVIDVNETPTVVNAIADQSEVEGFETIQISYATVFQDGDGDDLTLSISSDNLDVVTVSLAANNIIAVTEVGLGSSTITLTADDGRGGTVSDIFTFEVTEAPSTETDILTFALAAQTSAASINSTDHTVSIEVDRGTDLSALSPEITVSEGATVDPGSGTAQDFSDIFTYTVTAEDGTTTQDWTVTVTEALNTETDILTFTLVEETGTATINATDHTISIEVSRGTDLSTLNPDITLSAGATIAPGSGTAQDFSNEFTFTVTAEDGTTTQDWTVIVTDVLNTETDILTFTLAEETGTAAINTTDHTISIEVSRGTDLSALSPVITLSEGATVDPGSGTAQDYSSSITYTVTAEDGTTTQDWTVTVTEAPNTETDILTFTLAEETGTAAINATDHTISIEVSRGTDLSALSPVITLSEGATVDPGSGTAQDFSSSYTYTVTAEDGTTTQDWTVTVTVAPNTETDILTFLLAEQTGSATISLTDHTVFIEVNRGTELSTLNPDITLSAGATIDPVSGTVLDFSSPATYTVTAEDGTTTQDWIVTVTEAPNTETDILTFLLAEQTGSATISLTDHTVMIEVANGTDLTTLSPSITLSTGATIDPASDLVQDLSSAFTYTVTAEDGVTSQEWMVSVVEETLLAVGSMVDIHLYPNPVVDQLFIESSDGNQIMILDQQGRQLVSERFTLEMEVDLSDWPSGVYFIKIVNSISGNIYSNKVIKH